MPGVEVRATGDASWQSVLRVVVAGIRAGAPFDVSAPVGLPPAVRRVLSDVGVNVWVETDAEWIDRVLAQAGTDKRLTRVRLVGQPESVSAAHLRLSEAVGGDPDLAVYANEVTTAGRIELLPFLHEQSITITAHRFGNPDAWSESVI